MVDTMIDQIDFERIETGVLYLVTAQYSGVNIIKESHHEGGDLVNVAGDIWRWFCTYDDQARIIAGDHQLTALHYDIERDQVYAIVRPRPKVWPPAFGP